MRIATIIRYYQNALMSGDCTCYGLPDYIICVLNEINEHSN